MNAARNPALVLAAALSLAAALIPAWAHAADEKKPKGSYFAFTGLSATVLREDGIHGVMSVDAGIDVPDPKLHDLALMDQPRLYDAYGQVLQAYGLSLQPNHVPDIDYLNRQLQMATDRVLGRPGARFLLCGVMVN